MENTLINRFKSSLPRLHQALLGETPTAGTKTFFKHLGWIGTGFFISKGIAFLVTLSAGRLLGPVEFGKINLCVDVGTLLYAFSLWGMHNSIPKHGATLADEGMFRDMMGSAITLAALGTLGVGFAVLAAGPTLARMMSVSLPVFHFGWAYAMAFTVYSIFTSIPQAMHRIKERSLLEITFALSMAAAFTASLFCLGRTFKILSGAMITGYTTAGLAAAVLMRRYWTIGFNPVWFKRHLHYGAYGLGQSLSFFCLANLQRLLLNAFISTREAGVYSAYGVSSIAQAYYAANAVSIILLPKSSASANRASLWKKVCRGWAAASGPALAGIALFETITLFVMGHQRFGLDAVHVFVFALAALAIVVHGTLSSVLAAEGTRGAAFVLVVSVGMGLVNLFLGVLWIPAWASVGAALSIFVSYVLGLVWLGYGHTRYT
jgi:O-antigen/teichoic acid export membrane protein